MLLVIPLDKEELLQAEIYKITMDFQEVLLMELMEEMVRLLNHRVVLYF